jgi:hypothetical protein
MTKLVIENDPPYRLTPSSCQRYGGSRDDPPEVNAIAPAPP